MVFGKIRAQAFLYCSSFQCLLSKHFPDDLLYRLAALAGRLGLTVLYGRRGYAPGGYQPILGTGLGHWITLNPRVAAVAGGQR